MYKVESAPVTPPIMINKMVAIFINYNLLVVFFNNMYTKYDYEIILCLEGKKHAFVNGNMVLL